MSNMSKAGPDSYPVKKVKGMPKGLGTGCSAAYISRFKTSSALQSWELAADWYELMIPRRIKRPSIAHDSE